MNKNKNLYPIGGADYDSVKKAAQQIANEENREVNLWFNVRKGERPEKVKPEK